MDNAPNFKSREFQDFLLQKGTQHSFSSPYYPQGNSIVERFMRTLRSAFAIYTDTFQINNWDVFCPSVALAYNTISHASTKHTPMLLATGREAKIFKFRDEPPIELTNKQRLNTLLLVWEKVRKLFRKAFRNRIPYHRTPLKIGDIVRIRYSHYTNKTLGKLSPLYSEPYTVIKPIH